MPDEPSAGRRMLITSTQWTKLPPAAEGHLLVEQLPTAGYAEQRYRLYFDETPIGEIESRRSESWRQTSTGVRYGRRGKPLRWYVTRVMEIDPTHTPRGSFGRRIEAIIVVHRRWEDRNG